MVTERYLGGRQGAGEKAIKLSIPWFLRSGWRMFGTLFVVLALLTVTFTLIASSQIHQALKARATRQNALTARLTVPLVAEHFDSLKKYVESYAHRPSLVRAAEKKDAEGARAYLKELVANNPRIDRAFIVDAKGTLWTDYPFAPEVIGKNFSFRDWFSGVSHHKNTYLSGIYKRAAPPQPYLVAIATPIRNNRHEIVGYLVEQHTVDALAKWLAEIESHNVGTMTLLDNHGMSVTAHGIESLSSPIPHPSFGKAATGEEISEEAHDPITGEESLISYAAVEPIGWVVLARNPMAAVLKPIAAVQRAFFGFALLFFIVVTTLAFLWLNTIRRYHQALSDSETRFRSLLESAPDAIVSVNRDGLIELVNSQTEHWFGYERDELIGQPVETLIPESLRERHVANRGHYVMAPHTRSMGVDMELNGRRKNGSEFPIEVSLSPLKTKAGLLVISVIRDITARKLAEQTQFEAQERYRALVKNLPVGVYRNTPGPEGRFLEANPAIIDMFEADSVKGFLDTPVSTLYHDPVRRQAFVDKIVSQGSVKNEELQLVTLKGRPFWAAVTAIMKHDDEGNIFFDGIIEDITERKKAEQRIEEMNSSLRQRTAELETINKELESFSYSVSHDLRTPLRAIDDFSHALLEDCGDKLDRGCREYLERVRAAAQRMAVLIDDLLKLATVSRAELVAEEVNLSWLVEELVQNLRASEPQREVTVTITPDLLVRGDPRLLRIALQNLLANAWKFTSLRDRARIEFGLVEQGTRPVFRLRDNGIGFDMAYVDKIFAPFQRIHKQGEFHGTGIGLATVQRIIHKHGGDIWAESILGQGASFYFSL